MKMSGKKNYRNSRVFITRKIEFYITFDNW